MDDPVARNRVLVVDDDELIRQTFRRLLEAAGFDVVLAAGGADGLRILREDPAIALVLLDLEMPRMSGAAVRQAQLADPQLAQVPTVIVTGSGEEDTVRALRPDDYLRKPVPRERLVAVVSKYCARRPT